MKDLEKLNFIGRFDLRNEPNFAAPKRIANIKKLILNPPFTLYSWFCFQLNPRGLFKQTIFANQTEISHKSFMYKVKPFESIKFQTRQFNIALIEKYFSGVESGKYLIFKKTDLRSGEEK